MPCQKAAAVPTSKWPIISASTAITAARLAEQADEAFERGNQAREYSDKYVKATVLLATVLLLMATSQRFKTYAVRVGLAVVAALLLCLPLYHVLMLLRA